MVIFIAKMTEHLIGAFELAELHPKMFEQTPLKNMKLIIALYPKIAPPRAAYLLIIGQFLKWMKLCCHVRNQLQFSLSHLCKRVTISCNAFGFFVW